MNRDFYASWEWQPIKYMPDGCHDVLIRDYDFNIIEVCSCDYWWFSAEKKSKCIDFRFK